MMTSGIIKPYNSGTSDFETSHEVFRKAMPEGFAWEVLDVYSG